VSGSAVAGSAAEGSASTGSATAASGPQVAALDELDRWIAPIYKLDVPARYKAMCAAASTVREKVKALETIGPPSGVEAQAWSDAVGDLEGAVDGVRMCCQDLGDYEKASPEVKKGADSNHDDCMKPVPDAFMAVVKLVPGAKPAGTHANDPVMTPSK
jgi:hypothetical protein